MSKSHIKDTVDFSPRTTHFHAARVASCIADGIKLDGDAVYHLKATIAICRAALKGEVLRGADVYIEVMK